MHRRRVVLSVSGGIMFLIQGVGSVPYMLSLDGFQLKLTPS